jgi:transcriptional regulator with XRE-family HTH domain
MQQHGRFPWERGVLLVANRSPRAIDVLVGQNIRICRLQNGMSLRRLAARIGIASQQIHKYEKGANRIGASRLSEIAVALGVPAANLFDGSKAIESSKAEAAAGRILADPHALRLLRAFHMLTSRALQSAILEVVEFAGRGQPRSASKRQGAWRRKPKRARKTAARRPKSI